MKISAIIICVALTVFCIDELNAKDYYVSPNGSDSNPGTFALPWKTIQKAAATVIAGDSAIMMTGTYHERVEVQNSGNASGYITFIAGSGQQVTIDGSTLTVPEYGGLFDFSEKSYIRLSGIRIINSNEAGVLADGSSYIKIDNNSTYNTKESGIGVWNSNHVVIDGNQVELACTDGSQECITVAVTDSFEISNNIVFDCKKEGVTAKDGSSNGNVHRNHVYRSDHVGIYIDAWNKHTYNIYVFQNLIHDTVKKDGLMVASEQGGVLENIFVYNNIVYANGFNGIGISACCAGVSTHPIRSVKIVNNTCYNNGLSGWGGGILVYENPEVQNIIIRNNICSQNASFQIGIDPIVPPSQLTIDYNLIDGFRNAEGETRGNHYVEGDPRFVNSTQADFHIQSNSPAMDTGTSNGAPTTDYDGNLRPQGAAWDIGAFEKRVVSSVAQLWGAWPDAVWSWNPSTKQWTQIPSTVDAFMIAAGDVDGDKKDDLTGLWSSGLWVLQSKKNQWVKLSSSLPTWIAAGDMNNDGRDDIIGTWPGDGTYYLDSAIGKWAKMTTHAKQLATGNVHGDNRDDLIGVWSDGLWARYIATGSWQKFDATIPVWIAVGDMTGNGRADIVGSYSSGTWLRNSVTGAWTKLTTPAEQLACGDLDGDGRDDLIGIWSNTVWVCYSATGKWERISSSKPKWITTGKNH